MTESDKSIETAKDGAKAAAYRVLARKYRPQNFDDLIGHGPMVKTLQNAFASDRIAHAYILTGVRGVGKTTTARILARALNYVGPDGEDNGPQIEMSVEGRHCKAIAESRHPDVLEMDAASRTGVGDIRELIEGVRYAPVEARYKVYIIDEVHMLSTAAFNALLKTLEEPPAHVKFIFATTEIRKLPVTVLSRCQRFDLRRIDPDVLTDHLGSIAEKENVKIDRDGLWMIARAAEGSVRDGLSILDQAIVQHAAQKTDDAVSAEMIRDMLGLADRSSVWALLDACFKGDAKGALENFRAQYDAGAEPSAILRDLLDLTHLLTRIKAAGPAAASHGPAGEADAERAKTMADALEMNALTRAWSLLMKGLGETQIAPDAAASAEMALIRLTFAADLPTPDEALRALKKNSLGGATGSQNAGGGPNGGPQASQQSAQVYDLHPAPKPVSSSPQIKTFKDVIRLAGEKRDAVLRVELESYIHIVSFAVGRIELRLHDDAPPDLANRLALRLKEWTKSQWVISVTNEEQGEETVRGAREREVMEHPMVMHAMELFPGAEVTSIREVEAAIAPVPDDDEDMPIDPDDDAVAAAMSANKQRQETGKA
ncbi:DNA polymerase III subunit gamma/tau [Hyphococcus formosus]|uniref:DNA polymerase III subunit gamma/tau n=1 Tax=Hyphococcus formosus TaxID=3143534 RepID=UPI00398B08C2